jgi:hypothetical protein
MNKQIDEIAKIILEEPHLGGIQGFEERIAKHLYTAGYRKLPENIGDFSDGYHTFNELYHHRAVLFSVICNMMPENAWKSKLHDTGDMYDGMFIVGIETEHGQATYHYDINPYWDMFKVKELEIAPKWDGHTPAEAIQRIGNLALEGYRKQEWISVEDRLPEQSGKYLAYTRKGFTVFSYYYTLDGALGFEHWDVTHWMPLPEAPKRKGGENDA